MVVICKKLKSTALFEKKKEKKEKKRKREEIRSRWLHNEIIYEW